MSVKNISCNILELNYNSSKLDTNPTYLKLFEFEKRIDQNSWAIWHENNIYLSIVSSIFYLITIFTIQSLLKDRKGFKLRWSLFIWNLSLALFSIIGLSRTIPELIWIFKEYDNGIYTSICRRDLRNSATGFWGIMFGLSKIIELGDTLFIVLRKRPLIFLHYYHHVSVLIFTWGTASAINSYCTWFGVMNYAVHSIMYSYYALKVFRIKFPKWIPMIITCLQLAQMIIGIYINLYVLYAKNSGIPCATQRHHVYYALLMYTSYFILFGNYFRNAYINKSKKE